MPHLVPDFTWHDGSERLVLTTLGRDAWRVCATDEPGGLIARMPSALVDNSPCGESPIRSEPCAPGAYRAGNLEVVISPSGGLAFRRVSDGRALLAEQAPVLDAARSYRSGGAAHRVTATFAAQEGERLYGLGQHLHGRLDQKGCVIPLEQRNTQIAVPVLLSSLGYGFIWNLPSVGRVELGLNATRWVADHAPRIDYVVFTADTPAGLLARLAELTGLPRSLPDWAAGFWQSKLRYQSQAEVLGIAREFHRRGLPLDVLVIDYFHWTKMGEWCFDPVAWPDPAAMVAELRELGVEPMVSVWPTVNPQAETFPALRDGGLLVATDTGSTAVSSMFDTTAACAVPLALYDATHAEARDFVWQRVRDHYHAHGIRAFWLDACEPELAPFRHDRLRYAAGRGDAVGCAYPRFHQQTFHDGLLAAGEDEIVLLSRSAWCGSQRFGAVVWSGDVPSTFASLAAQIPAGLNMALSGIPWWNTDIGGFHGGDPDDPLFRELIVRWFQYAVFTPVCRLHGVRAPADMKSGGPNEPWSFGPEVEERLIRQLRLRRALRPYILQQWRITSKTGLPCMRPLFVDFPDDARAWEIADQFLFGDRLLVAPITGAGVTAREVYLPISSRPWLDVRDGAPHPGGNVVRVAVDLDSIPVFTTDPDLLRLFTAA